MEKFRADNWDTLTSTQRRDLFATLNAYLSSILTTSLLFPEIYTAEDNINGKWLEIQDGRVYVNKKVFDRKSNGLEILRGYFLELRVDLMYAFAASLYQCNADRSKLQGLVKVYYDNLAQSNLYNTWHNFYKMDHKDYTYQPFIIDAVKLSNEIMFDFAKRLYKKYNVMDKELSSLVYNLMEFRGKIPFYKQERSRVIKEQSNNLKNVDKEYNSYKKYLKLTISNLSKLSDDDFYSLFNMNYYYGLNIDDDGFLVARLTNLTNELVYRFFKEYDLTHVELPVFKFALTKDNLLVMHIIYNNEVKEAQVADSNMIMDNVMQAMSELAKKNKFFKFKDEQEEKDYDDMRAWDNYKKVHDPKESIYQEIIHDGLNIISRKVNEMWRSLELRVKEGIANSNLLIKGKSMIRHDNKEAYYDYHEFKNGLTQEEVTKSMMDIIRDDMDYIFNKGGR